MSKHRDPKNKHRSIICRGERPTPERRHQSGGVRREIVGRDATGKVFIERYKANEECALDHYFRTRKITSRQRAAGMRFREICTRVDNHASSKVLGSPFASEAGQSDHEWRMLAYIECVEALDAAYARLTPVQRIVVRNVCGFDIYAGHNNDKKTLARALEALAEFWKIK